jgi:hypothetical protein
LPGRQQEWLSVLSTHRANTEHTIRNGNKPPPAVHEQRLAQLQCQRHLRREPLLLHVGRAEVAVEVEAAFTCEACVFCDNVKATASASTRAATATTRKVDTRNSDMPGLGACCRNHT